MLIASHFEPFPTKITKNILVFCLQSNLEPILNIWFQILHRSHRSYCIDMISNSKSPTFTSRPSSNYSSKLHFIINLHKS
jgi:hypothetical protein